MEKFHVFPNLRTASFHVTQATFTLGQKPRNCGSAQSQIKE